MLFVKYQLRSNNSANQPQTVRYPASFYSEPSAESHRSYSWAVIIKDNSTNNIQHTKSHLSYVDFTAFFKYEFLKTQPELMTYSMNEYNDIISVRRNW